MTNAKFTTLEGRSESREEVRGSVFLAFASRIDSIHEVNEFLRALIVSHPDASHLCWAYRLGNQYRFSDGGEPGGTAGQPILRAIDGQSLNHVAVGVIRYFGGTLLGAGGLMRAYGGVAAEALRKARRHEAYPRIHIQLRFSFEHIGAVYRLLDAHQADERLEHYTEDGLTLVCRVFEHRLAELERTLGEAARGQVEISLL